jgi:hypothetical protein
MSVLDKNQIESLLDRAAELVASGWTQMWYAVKFEQDKTVKKEKIVPVPVKSKSPEATHFCMMGGILRAIHEKFGDDATNEITEAAIKPLRDLCLERFGAVPGVVNDRMKSGEEAAAVLREAKNYA